MQIAQMFGPVESLVGPGADHDTSGSNAVTIPDTYCRQHSIKRGNNLNEQ